MILFILLFITLKGVFNSTVLLSILYENKICTLCDSNFICTNLRVQGNQQKYSGKKSGQNTKKDQGVYVIRDLTHKFVQYNIIFDKFFNSYYLEQCTKENYAWHFGKQCTRISWSNDKQIFIYLFIFVRLRLISRCIKQASAQTTRNAF